MFGIISCKKEELLEKCKPLLDDNIPGEFFKYGFFSIFPAEKPNCFFAKDNSNRKIIIFEGKLYIDNYEINPNSDREKILETIFSLYSKKGLDFLSCLKGEFILGLWDQDTERFLLARDKLGRRHIYYSLKNDFLIFSSKISYFYHYNFIEKDISLDALNLYLSFKFIPSPYTIYRDIFKLPSASTIIRENGSLYTKKYWGVNADRLGKKRKFEHDVAEVERLIKKSVERRVSQSKNICLYLSGGTDSSTIVSIAARLKEKNLSVFCVNDENRFEDVKCASLVAKHFNINYYERAITWLDVINYLPEVIKILEEPVADPVGLYLYLINVLAKNYGDIILSGEGGDVLFGGHRFCYLLDLANRFSFIYPRKFFDYVAKFTSNPSFRYRILALRDSVSREKSFLDVLSAFPREDREKIFTHEARKRISNDLDIEILKPYFKKTTTFIDSLTIFLLENYVPDMYLIGVNKLAMANSIEHTAPFLDEDLVEYVFTIPKSNIFNIRNRKIILKMILKKFGVPPEVIYRKKSGLVSPTGKWLKKGLDKWMREVLSYKNISSQGFFNYSQIEKIFRFAEKDLRAQFQLWSLANFTLWFKIFISKDDIS